LRHRVVWRPPMTCPDSGGSFSASSSPPASPRTIPRTPKISGASGAAPDLPPDIRCPGYRPGTPGFLRTLAPGFSSPDSGCHNFRHWTYDKARKNNARVAAAQVEASSLWHLMRRDRVLPPAPLMLVAILRHGSSCPAKPRPRRGPGPGCPGAVDMPISTPVAYDRLLQP